MVSMAIRQIKLFLLFGPGFHRTVKEKSWMICHPLPSNKYYYETPDIPPSRFYLLWWQAPGANHSQCGV
jgi:hypothetical protein